MASSLENMTTEQLQESTKLLHTLLNSPDTREDTLRLIKKKNGVPIPEIDSKDAVLAEVAKEREERKKLETRMQERDIMERIEKERAKVKQAHNLSDADVLEVEKLMVDKDAPIPSYAAAAKVYQASKQVAQPTTHLLKPNTYDMPEKSVWAPGIGNKQALNKIALEEAYKAANEFRAKGGAVTP
jgi:hypothetical protein